MIPSMQIQLTKNIRVHFLPPVTLSAEQLRKSRRTSSWIWGINAGMCALACGYFLYRGDEWGQFVTGFLAVMNAFVCVAAALRARA